MAQAAQSPLSSLHSKLEPASLEEKTKPAEVEVVVAGGPLTIEVCGGVVSAGGGVVSVSSTFQLSVAGVASMFLAASMARTENWWVPSSRALYVFGVAQDDQLALSSLHWKVEVASLDLKPKFAESDVVTAGGALTIEVCGGVVSPGGGVTAFTVQLWVAGVVSTFLVASMARTENW